MADPLAPESITVPDRDLPQHRARRKPWGPGNIPEPNECPLLIRPPAFWFEPESASVPAPRPGGDDDVDDERIARTRRLRQSEHVIPADEVPPADNEARQRQAEKRAHRYNAAVQLAADLAALGVNGARVLLARYGARACGDILALIEDGMATGELVGIRNPAAFYVATLRDHAKNRRNGDATPGSVDG